MAYIGLVKIACVHNIDTVLANATSRKCHVLQSTNVWCHSRYLDTLDKTQRTL